MGCLLYYAKKGIDKLMSDNNSSFKIILQATLDKIKSIANIKADIKAIEAKLPKIKIKGTLDKTATNKEINTKIKDVKPKVKVDADTTNAEKKIKKLGKQKTETVIKTKTDNSQVVSGIKEAQKETKTLWERFTSGITGINLIQIGVQKIVQTIHQAIVNIKKLDAIKTNIQMVSGTSDSEVNAMMGSYNSMAKELSSTTKDVASAANEFLRMGESVETTNELIRSSQVLSKIGMIESSDAANYLISSLKGYQVAAKDSMDIVSKLTAVDMEAAVSAGGLSEALSKCSNIANNSGISMDRLIGYTATVGEITQKSMSEVGNSFQSLLSRMSNIKIGRFIDDETGESLSDTEAVLNKLGIRLRETEDTYRDFDDVLDDVGSRWKDFTKVEQNAISVAIAGTRQRENFEALMNNWTNALKYSETAANSAGSALERYGVYQDSIEAKTNELTAAIESLSTNTISEELYSGIIVATTNIVEFIDKANLLKGTLAGIITMGVSKTFVSIASSIISASRSTAQLTAAMKLFDNGRSADNLRDIGAACKGLSRQQLKLVLSTKDLTDKERLKILAGMGVEKQERKQMLATLGFAAAEDKATASTFSLKGAINTLSAAFAANPIGFVLTAVSALVTIIPIATSVVSSHNQKLEETRQKAAELAETYAQQQSSLDSQIKKYKELKESLDKGNLSTDETRSIKEQLLEIQNSLVDSFGAEASNIDLVNGKYSEQLGLLNELSKEKANIFITENRDTFNEAKKVLEEIREYDLGQITNWSNLYPKTEEQQALLDYIRSYSDLFKITEDRMSDGEYSYEARNLKIYATVEDADEVMHKFAEDLREYAEKNGIDVSGILESIPEQIRKTQTDELKEYKSIYDEYMKASIVSDDTLRPLYQQSIQAVEDYNKALSSGEGITEAKANLNNLQQSVQNATVELEGSQAIFDGIYEGINKNAEAAYQLSQAFENDSTIQKYAEQLRGLSDIDIKAIKLDNENIEKGEEAFRGLLETLGYNDPTKEQIQRLIDKLVELGYVAGETQKAVQNASASFSDIFALKDADNNLNTLGELNNQLNEIQSAYSNLTDAMDEYSSTGYITIDQFQAIVEQGANFLDYLTLEDGQLGVNEQAMYDLAEARIVEMKAQMIQGVVDNVSKIQSEADADLYLASTNYELADSYHALATAQLQAWSTSALENGLSQNYVDNVTTKANNDISKIEALMAKIDVGSIGGSRSASKASSSAAKEAEKDWKNLLDKEINLLEKQLNAGIITFKEYTDKRRAIIDDYYRDGKISAQEYYDALEDMYKDQLSNYDKVIKAVTARIDKQIDSLEDEKDAIEKSYKVKIDAIQEEIDALEAANKARQDQIDLEKAQYELDRALNQRTQKVYNGTEFIYKNDPDSIRNAQDNLADKEYELNISRLKSQIESLEEEMNNSTKVIDDNIEALKKYRDAWNEIPDELEKVQNALLANQILGANWENEILDGRMATLDIFKNNYIAAQQAMADAAWQSANEQIKAAQAAQAGASGTTGSAPTITTSNNSETSKTKTSGGGGSAARLEERKSKNFSVVAMYGTGTDHAKKGLNLVGEDGTETFIDNDGNASLITKPTLIPMEGGETVKNAEETEELLAPVRLIPLGIAEPLLFNPYETEIQELMDNIPGSRGVEHTPISSMVQHHNFDQMPMNVNQDQSIKMSFGDINLHGVQNEDTFAKAIITKWPNKVNQALSRRMR